MDQDNTRARSKGLYQPEKQDYQPGLESETVRDNNPPIRHQTRAPFRQVAHSFLPNVLNPATVDKLPSPLVAISPISEIEIIHSPTHVRNWHIKADQYRTITEWWSAVTVITQEKEGNLNVSYLTVMYSVCCWEGESQNDTAVTKQGAWKGVSHCELRMLRRLTLNPYVMGNPAWFKHMQYEILNE